MLVLNFNLKMLPKCIRIQHFYPFLKCYEWYLSPTKCVDFLSSEVDFGRLRICFTRSDQRFKRQIIRYDMALSGKMVS